MTEQESRRGKSRRERVEFARSRDILDVANELQMELVRSGRDYRWKEHDSLVISPDKNLWKWFSRNTGGDAISLVETIKEVDFNQSVDFLNDGNFKEFQMVERAQEDFKYYLEKYEQPFSVGRDYLRNQRGLSDETIDYFLEQGVLAQANAKLDYFAEGNGGVTINAIEPVIVFKSLSSSGEVVGASLQGIQENWEKWPKHGYAKVIMKNSDPMTGIHVDIGSPKRLIFTESPIDLMSYYELHKDSLQDVRLVSMDGLKESTIGRHLSQIQAEISGKPLRWTPEQLADGLQVAIDHHFFEDGKNADLITLALDNDKAGRTFIQELEAKGAVINSDLPELKPGQDKTDWNDVLKNQQEEKPDNSRLAQARRKLERLRGEQDEAISRAYSHQALTNGQPMNDKRGGASFKRKQEQIEDQVFSKMDEIRQQEERVERLEHQQHLKEMGLNRQGSGLEMSVQNIPRIREELEKAKRGESFFTKSTLKRYQEELTRLEAISEQMGKTSIQPATQALIDEGLVNQWQKQPNTYFVKGLRRVALELTEEGEFQLSSQTKYHPKTDEERLKVDELLAKQGQENVGLTPSNQEKTISPQPEPIEKNQGEAGWLEKNWDNLTFSIENKKTVVIDPTSIDEMVEEKQTPENQESIVNTEENAGRTMSYEEVKRENEALTKELNNRIQAGELSIEFAPDFYLYDVFAKLGNSHPTKYLSDKKMEVLSPIHSLLTSIDDQTIDLYKKKGTPEQDSLYQALKPHQRTLGVDISTRFIGELAIAAYNTNKQIESLSSNSFGVYYDERTLDNLSQSIERMLEYPLIESGKRDFTYGFVTTPNTLYHYLEEQEGEVVLNRELLDNLMSRLDTQSVKIMEVSEEVEPVRPVIVLKQDELYSDYWRVYQSDGELEFYLFEDGQFGYRQYGSLSQKEDNIVFKYHSEPGKTEFLATQMGYDSLKYIVVKDWESLFDENKALLRENYVFDDLENFLKESNYFELDYWTFDSGLKQAQKIAREDEEFLNEITKKAHDQNQELSNNTGGELLNRNSSFLGVETPGTAPQPVEKNSQPDFPANVHLHFTIDEDRMSNKIFRKNMRTLNLYANAMRDSAQWYLKEMSGTSIHYVYKNPEEKQFQILNVKFDKKNWMHLTGVTPVYNEWVEHLSESFVEDVAAGKGHFKDLKFAQGMSDKLKVLNLLPEVIESDSFVFNDLSSVKKFNNLDLSKAIRPEDTDLLLLFKEKEFTHVPASLMRVKGDLSKQLEDIDTGTILGVYRERDGHIEQLSINEEYVKDGGEEMLSVLKNKQYEEVSEEPEPPAPENTLNKTSLDSATFTQVLDTVYNLGVPGDISKTPKEFHQAWNQYLDYAKQYNDKFDQIVAAAGEDHLLDTNSDFYKEWIQDHIYKENYHVRLQWSEERPEGPILPFKETELISYQDFARELYKANQDFYPIHQEGMKQVTVGNTEGYIPPTKIKFDVYAPGGKVIKEGIRYDIGDETTPISQMLGLGYRRLNGQSELASMDEEILSQLENRVVNKEISQEANESSRLIEEGEGQTPDTRKTVAFQSSKQETKTNLLQRVEEILKEEPISDLETPEVNSSSIDYAALTPHELSEVAFQKVREYTETPERLEEYLNFMSKFPELSPRNVALIQEQWPGANAVATYNQWQSMGEVLGITSDQVFETRNTYTNKKTGRTREVVHNNLSVKTGEKSHITLFRPMMVEMIPVLDENGNQVKNGKGNPKYKRLSEATPEEKALKKEGKLKSRFFQERDSNTGLAKFATYKVFELSQTTLKPEFYPKAMPNRHYDFNMDHVRTKEVLEGLSDYANSIGVTIYQDDAKELRSAKGAFYPDEQKILLNPDNTPGEVVATTIHELAHASLHNPKFANSYKEDVSKDRRELEAEMTSYLVSKHFGLDTSEKAIRYMAIWTDNLTSLDDQQLAQSMKRIHGTVSKIVKSVEQHTKPYQLNRQVVQNQNFIQSPKKGLKV
ncbi:PBECR4 domain-containing protein [Streptococcus pneumoniae]|uniref:PBECR4 domain-containing protein n=1 Tax=Streptococcus pneumoniae TaxID=1313 RepID=UPI0005E3CE53|nr:PBECR4 domain-containing protein [Streptococcus pneumoniae]CGG36838.1 DNA primase [Streptococcus pneumoniae]CJQ29689.1 DNA primase [Streptococcus pneumoniae]CJX78591.1 DNA primase [Streptococcus pneumoniae]